MSKIVVTHNFKRLETLLTGLGDRKEVQKVVARSIKRTLTGARKTAVAEIRARKFLKMSARELKSRIHLYDEARASKPVEQQYGKIWIGSRPENLGKFYARRILAGRLNRQSESGGWQGVRLYRVQLNQYGAPYLRDTSRAFLVDRGSGKVVFSRIAGAKRLPITKETGPSLAELAANAGIPRRIADAASTRYLNEFDTNVRFYAERALARATAQK
jgi:hypothetical protein